MILVDSSIWISALHNVDGDRQSRLRSAIRTGGVIVGDLILLEVLRGARNEPAAMRARQAMAAFPVVTLGGRQMAERAADHYRDLRSRGITIRGSIDVLIATFCIAHGHLLLHADRDYTHFERHLGLKVY